MPSALWWVTNGFAAAPPASIENTGVSTSMKSRAWSSSRSARVADDRTSNVRRDSSLAYRSTSRSRSRISDEVGPRCLSGDGRSDAASS